MKALVCIRSYWFFKNVEPQIRELLARGHDVVLLVTTEAALEVSERDRLGDLDVAAAIERLKAEYPAFSMVRTLERADRWMPFVNDIRRGIDLVHLLGGRFDGKPRLRRRAVDRATPTMARYAVRMERRGRLAKLGGRLRRADAGVPPERRMVELLRAIAPDVMAITPLVALGCNQNELLRAAVSLEIPTVFNVHSWDNLSMKSPLRCRPTRMVVWNEVQRREAVEYHGYPADRVEISGAPHFDDWHDLRPKRSREAFMRDAGLDPDRPLVTYLCSTVFDFQRLREQDFVKRWVAALRESAHPVLREAGIIVRVHPQRVHIADQFLHPGDERMVVWPRRTTAPVGDAAKDDYLSSLAHADAVVGINTTGMVEAAYLGRPVLTILGTEFADSQDGTFHFGYLVNDGAGMIRAATSMDAHLDRLAAAVSGEAPFSQSERDYVRMFVRPQGEASSAARFVDILERTASIPVPADPLRSRRDLWAVLAGLTTIQAVEKTRRGLALARRLAYRLAERLGIGPALGRLRRRLVPDRRVTPRIASTGTFGTAGSDDRARPGSIPPGPTA